MPLSHSKNKLNTGNPIDGILTICYYTYPVLRNGRKGVNTLAHIIIDDSENLEKAIKRFKRMVEKEGIIREYKKREYYEKPSTIQNRKNKTLQRKLLKKKRSVKTTRNAY